MAFPSGQGTADKAVGVGRAAIEKPRLFQQVEILYKTLQVCHDHTAALEQAVDRILGPTPQDPHTPTPKPPTETVEQKLAELGDLADMLSVRLLHTVQRLNAAV